MWIGWCESISLFQRFKYGVPWIVRSEGRRLLGSEVSEYLLGASNLTKQDTSHLNLLWHKSLDLIWYESKIFNRSSGVGDGEPCIVENLFMKWCVTCVETPVQARITKFGPEVQNTLVKILIVWGFIDFDLQGQIELESQNLPYFELVSLSMW